MEMYEKQIESLKGGSSSLQAAEDIRSNNWTIKGISRSKPERC
jgi:hypothetical protein